MKTADIIETSQGQAVRLPDEFRFAVTAVSTRREGEARRKRDSQECH